MDKKIEVPGILSALVCFACAVIAIFSELAVQAAVFSAAAIVIQAVRHVAAWMVEQIKKETDRG